MQDQSNSSLPLVDFISKWRSNENTENTAEPNSPLLLNTNKYSSSEGLHSDVPYPAPESFLPGRVPQYGRHLSEDTTDTEEDTDDDDEAQSIKSYNSDHIRTYDRLSLSRVTSSNSDHEKKRSEIIDIPYLDEEYSSTKIRGCFSRLCTWSRAKSQESIELQERYSDNKISDSKKTSKNRSKRSRYYFFKRLSNAQDGKILP